jgi:hypothetical protein
LRETEKEEKISEKFRLLTEKLYKQRSSAEVSEDAVGREIYQQKTVTETGKIM